MIKWVSFILIKFRKEIVAVITNTIKLLILILTKISLNYIILKGQ